MPTLQELEQRIARLERNVNKKATGNPMGDLTLKPYIGRRKGTPPTVTGLELTRGVGTVTATWDNPGIYDFKRFEIQIAYNNSFQNPEQTAYLTTNIFTWANADTSKTWYVRVRTINQIGKEGPWSNIANSSPGLVHTHNINSEAAAALASVKKSGGFYPGSWTVGSGSSQYYDVARMNVTFDETADIEIAGTYQFYLDIHLRDTATVTLLMDDVVYARSEFQQGVSHDPTLTMSGTLQANVSNVPSGSHRFRAQMGISDSNNDGSNSTITPDEIEMQVYRNKMQS